MRQYNVSIYDPPDDLRSGAALAEENRLRSRPFAAIFADDSLKDICRLYGYLMLLGQNLEVELRVCLSYLNLALLLKGKSPRFAGDPEKANFNRLIRMFESQLDTGDPGSSQLVEDLHEARKFRNRLAHGFLDVGESPYYLTPGGRESVLHRLKLAESIFFPLVMVVNMVGRAYAADLGVTAEYVQKKTDLWKAEQAQIERELDDIDGQDGQNDKSDELA